MLHRSTEHLFPSPIFFFKRPNHTFNLPQILSIQINPNLSLHIYRTLFCFPPLSLLSPTFMFSFFPLHIYQSSIYIIYLNQTTTEKNRLLPNFSGHKKKLATKKQNNTHEHSAVEIQIHNTILFSKHVYTAFATFKKQRGINRIWRFHTNFV
jgi:hypothetical protein